MILLLLIVLLLTGACQPLDNTVSDLSAVRDGKRVYLQMQLGDFGVIKKGRILTEHMPAKLHALYYDGIEVSPLSLNGLQLEFTKFIVFSHVVLSWRHKKDSSGTVYTCHLHGVSLGEQRDIIEAGSISAPFCFEQQVGVGNDPSGGNYVHLLAEHCASLSQSKESRFVFLDDKDFACDVSDDRDGSIVLRASCLDSESAASCLEGKIRACAAVNVGFPKFVESFKARVAGGRCNEEYKECTFDYSLKASEAETDNGQDTDDVDVCPALAVQTGATDTANAANAADKE